ncbi:ATP-binding response regulator [Kineosporia babensis]|uniref:histidine kinase n=1 Tax=Kineosporia babensis TaxID=499548 RepID=A0A9X1NLH4_9ACTN|nr:ATP-binding protein [Kineosporia babensis]MCD5315321.1 ATP-binding protein [Kineosporia babensis]
MPSPLRLLLVEDRPDDAELLLLELKRAGYQPIWTRAETPEEFVAGLAEQPDIVLCDYSLPAMTAPDALRMLQEQQQDIPLIVVSGVMDEDTCVNSLRLGASDYLLKDRLVRLAPAIEHALAKRRLSAQARVIEQQSRETAEILRGVVDHAPAAICVRDATGRTLLTNTEFDRLRPTGNGGRPAVLDRRKLTSVEQACLDGADKVEGEEIWSVDGEDRTFLTVRYPVVDGSGRRFAIGAIYVDITRQKQVEEELRELDRMKGEFVATVSHELRTPLTSITGYAEMLLAGDADPVHTKMIEVIDRNSRRLLTLVEDLLTLSRVDSNIAARMDEQVDVAELVNTAVGVLTPAMESQGVELQLQLMPALPHLIGNRSQLERVLLNLLSNAVKFSTAGGLVTIAASVPDISRPAVEIRVKDSGIGIPVEEQDQLFTRFFRTEQARHQAIQGTGLGLAVVRQIVEGHHGTIGVESAADEGATFIVTLPAMNPAGLAVRL